MHKQPINVVLERQSTHTDTHVHTRWGWKKKKKKPCSFNGGLISTFRKVSIVSHISIFLLRQELPKQKGQVFIGDMKTDVFFSFFSHLPLNSKPVGTWNELVVKRRNKGEKRKSCCKCKQCNNEEGAMRRERGREWKGIRTAEKRCSECCIIKILICLKPTTVEL